MLKKKDKALDINDVINMTWKDVLKMDEIDSDFMDMSHLEGDDFKKFLKIKNALRQLFSSEHMIREVLQPVYDGMGLDEFIDDEISNAEDEDAPEVKTYVNTLKSIKGM